MLKKLLAKTISVSERNFATNRTQMVCLAHSLPSRGDVVNSCCSEHDLRTSSIAITWKFVRKAESQALPQILDQNLHLTRSQEIQMHINFGGTLV